MTQRVPHPTVLPQVDLLHEPHFPIQPRVARQIEAALRRPIPSPTHRRFDLDATLTERTRRGVVTPPIFVSEQHLLPQLVVLVDRGGSMAPFHALCDTVLDAMGLLTTSPRRFAYFHDLPDPAQFYADPERIEPVQLDLANRPLMILSDAGAARHGRDRRRVKIVAALLRSLSARCIVWLNPLAGHHWIGTSAELLCAEGVAQFPLDDEGLRRAAAHIRRRA